MFIPSGSHRFQRTVTIRLLLNFQRRIGQRVNRFHSVCNTVIHISYRPDIDIRFLTHEVLTVTCLVHEILLIIRLDAAGSLESVAGSVLVEIVRHDREVSHDGFAEIEDITGV